MITTPCIVVSSHEIVERYCVVVGTLLPTLLHLSIKSSNRSPILADDELDELFNTNAVDQFSTCYIFDVSDLDGPIAPPIEFITSSENTHPSIDHNLYIKDGYIYQASYTSGARIRRILSDNTLEEVAYFNVENQCECVRDVNDPADTCACDYFTGTWTYYPYFDSGTTIAGSIASGLFILLPRL